MKQQCTEVFEENWDAIHLECFLVEQIDEEGNFKIFIEDEEDGELKHITDYKFDLSLYRLDHGIKISYLSIINDTYPDELSQYKTRRYKYIVNEGSSRSSKTYSLIDCYDIYSRSNLAKRCTIWRDTKTDCKKTVLSDMLKHHKKIGHYKNGYEFNKTESIFHYTSGSTVEIHGTDDEETVHGLTQDAAWLNEPYKISQDTFDQIDQRTNDFIFIDWNPKKAHWINKLEKHERAIFIYSTYKKNALCPIESRRKLDGYEPWLSGSYDVIDRKLFYKGKSITETNQPPPHPVNVLQGTANKYKWMVYGLGIKSEKPNKIYNGWKKIPRLEFDRLPYTSYYWLDFGETNPTAFGEVKYNDRNAWVNELIYKPRKEMDSLIEELERLGIEKGVDLIICDDASPEKILELQTAGFYAVGANKGRVVDGISFVSKLNMHYTDTSHNIEDEYEGYEWEVDRYGLPTEKPIKKKDHHMDGIRYDLNYLKWYLEISI